MIGTDERFSKSSMFDWIFGNTRPTGWGGGGSIGGCAGTDGRGGGRAVTVSSEKSFETFKWLFGLL